MYGTICRFQLKPGTEVAMLESLGQEFDAETIPGARGEYIYRMDSNPNEFYLVVIFESEEAYKKNAASPDQDARYRKFRSLLAADPEWHDGQIIYNHVMETMGKM
jgi:quinol monooxygenase YgiN